MANFCGKCGTRLDPETGLCPKCDANKGNKSLKIFGMIIASLVVVAVVATGTYFILKAVFGKDTTKKTDDEEITEELITEEETTEEETTEEDITEEETTGEEVTEEEIIEEETEEEFIINTYTYTLAVGEYVDIDIHNNIEYKAKSNDENIVQVVNGQLYGIGAGETTVTVNYKSGKCNLLVTVVDTGANVMQNVSITNMVASSTLAAQGQYSYEVDNLFDGDTGTCWAEGTDGYGIGETVTITFDGTTELVNFVLSNGYQRTYDTFNNNGRTKVLEFTFDDGTETVTVDDSYSDVEYTFSNSHTTDSVVITIKEVYDGDKYTDTCISELEFNVYD